MSLPPIPPPLESLGSRPFSFYPAIIGIEHNEWQFRKGTWSEILVVNTASSNEIWIPRRFLGEVSRVDDPVAIVGLSKELEYKAGAVWPYQRRVIEMPVAVGGAPLRVPDAQRPEPAPVVNVRAMSPTDTRIFKLIGGVLLVATVAYFIMANLFREGVLRPRVTYTTKDQSYLELGSHDDYYAIVAKLGPPANDRWMDETGAIQYRALSYPQRSYTVILMGSERKSALYVGTMDSNWRPVHAVELRRGGGDTFSMLRGLKPF